MELLGVKDFKDTKFGPNWSPFDYLLEVARVGQEKIQKQNFNIRGAKYFQNDNAPQLETLFTEEEAMGFKQGRSLNKDAKLKRKHRSKGEGGGEGLKSKRSKKERPVCPNRPLDLPENFKNHILEKMGGSDWTLVIQKPMFYSDVNPQASRLSIPISQIYTQGFLTDTEAEDLDAKKSIQVCLLEPNMKETCLTFKRWNMEKSSMYVLTTMWNSVVKNNGLEIDDIVQLWSFRVESTLCFALVKVQTPTRN